MGYNLKGLALALADHGVTAVLLFHHSAEARTAFYECSDLDFDLLIFDWTTLTN